MGATTVRVQTTVAAMLGLGAALTVGVAASPRVVPASGILIRIDAPADRQVIQRGADDAAMVQVRGQVRGAGGRVLIRVRLRDAAASGRAVGWRMLDDRIDADGSFLGQVRLAAGGWYSLDICTISGTRVGPVVTVERVGVGEVFILSGQSNACNMGDLDPSYRVDDRVSAFGGVNWVPAANPLPFGQGNGGSPWVYMANRLVGALDVPIGLYPIAYGATSVQQWQPGTPIFNRLVAGLKAMRERGGLRAVLWHQGETDRGKGPALYGRLLTNLITQSRTASGVNIAWVIARASYGPNTVPLPFGADPCDPRYQRDSIRLAQCEIARTLPRCYPGPTTDDLGPPYRETTYRIHMNTRGLAIHGSRWADVLLHTPALIPGQPIPPP